MVGLTEEKEQEQYNILGNLTYEFSNIKRCLDKLIFPKEQCEADIKTIKSFVSELIIPLHKCVALVSNLDDDNLKRELNTEVSCILRAIDRLVKNYMYILTHPEEEYKRYVQGSIESVDGASWEISTTLEGCNIIIRHYNWKQIVSKRTTSVTDLGTLVENMSDTFNDLIKQVK